MLAAVLRHGDPASRMLVLRVTQLQCMRQRRQDDDIHAIGDDTLSAGMVQGGHERAAAAAGEGMLASVTAARTTT